MFKWVGNDQSMGKESNERLKRNGKKIGTEKRVGEDDGGWRQ